MLLRENWFTEIAREGFLRKVRFTFMLLRENRYSEIAREGVFP